MGPRIRGFPPMVGLREKAQAAIDHFHRDGGKQVMERFSDLIGEIDQHGLQQPGVPQSKFDTFCANTGSISTLRGGTYMNTFDGK